jgi:hypothetical protein
MTYPGISRGSGEARATSLSNRVQRLMAPTSQEAEEATDLQEVEAKSAEPASTNDNARSRTRQGFHEQFFVLPFSEKSYCPLSVLLVSWRERREGMGRCFERPHTLISDFSILFSFSI